MIRKDEFLEENRDLAAAIVEALHDYEIKVGAMKEKQNEISSEDDKV